MQQAVIFDFDDTLVVTTELFDMVRHNFCRLMEDIGVGIPNLARLVDELDVKNVKRTGYFAAHCFPAALCEAYEHCCRVNRQPVLSKVSREVERMGWAVHSEKPSTLDNAHQVLERLQKHYPLLLLTKGDKDLQKRRIDESGLRPYFADTFIVGDKNTALFIELIKDLKLKPGDSWSVGNSMKSDINPALLAGMQAIHIAGTTWHFEEAEPVADHYKAKNLVEVEKIILGRKEIIHPSESEKAASGVKGAVSA